MNIRARLRSGVTLRSCAALAGQARPQTRRPPPAIPAVDTGDAAWMLTCTALVLMMTVPGLALFYGGMVRKENILATHDPCFPITCIVTIVWMSPAAASPSPRHRRPRPMSGLSRPLLNGIWDHISKGVDTGFILGAGTDGAGPGTIPQSLYHVSDDLRDHRPGPDRRCLRRPR